MSLIDDKQSARRAAQNNRRKICALAPPDAATTLATNVLHLISRWGGGLTVSGFLSISNEIDMQPSLEALTDAGQVTCLPVVIERAKPLSFRLWKKGDPLESGPLQTRHPLGNAETVEPVVLLVPLLAFDRRGNRVGWGGGFYDRTLADLKSRNGDVIAVGIGFDGQSIERVPVGDHDVAMDWIVTEKQIIEITKAEP